MDKKGAKKGAKKKSGDAMDKDKDKMDKK
jgi:hypothetical protein